MPRRLIVVYAALTILLNVVGLLPGNPDYSSKWGFVASIAIQSLIVWRLWHGSSLAWIFGLGTALLGAVSILLIGSPTDTTTALFFAVLIAQASILVLPPLPGFVWGRGGRSPASR